MDHQILIIILAAINFPVIIYYTKRIPDQDSLESKEALDCYLVTFFLLGFDYIVVIVNAIITRTL